MKNNKPLKEYTAEYAPIEYEQTPRFDHQFATSRQQQISSNFKDNLMHLIEDTSQLDITKVKKAYDGLISERNQHTDVQLINTVELLSNGEAFRDVHISYPTQLILRKFKRHAKKHNFLVIDSFCDEMYLLRNRFCSRVKLALCCLLPSYRPASSRFYVYTDEYRSVRVVVLQSLNCTDSSQLKRLLNDFCDKHFPNPPLVEDFDNEQDLKTLEATSRYMYSKMLLEENYSMGQKVSAFLQEVPHEVTLQNIQWIEDFKNQIVEDMQEGFNCSRKELTQILCFCRIVVEEFLYSRIFPNVGEQPVGKFDLKDPMLQHFPNTIKELLKLNTTISPTLFDKQSYYVLTAMDLEYDKHRQKNEANGVTCHPNRLDQLVMIMRALPLPNLRSRMKIQELYHQINSEPEHYHEFERKLIGRMGNPNDREDS